MWSYKPLFPIVKQPQEVFFYGTNYVTNYPNDVDYRPSTVHRIVPQMDVVRPLSNDVYQHEIMHLLMTVAQQLNDSAESYWCFMPIKLLQQQLYMFGSELETRFPRRMRHAFEMIKKASVDDRLTAATRYKLHELVNARRTWKPPMKDNERIVTSIPTVLFENFEPPTDRLRRTHFLRVNPYRPMKTPEDMNKDAMLDNKCDDGCNTPKISTQCDLRLTDTWPTNYTAWFRLHGDINLSDIKGLPKSISNEESSD